MRYADHLKMKIKHNSPLRLIFDFMIKIGLRVTPYYLFCLQLDRFSVDEFIKVSKKFAAFTFRPIREKDFPKIAAVTDRNLSQREIMGRFKDGDNGFCAVHKGAVVSFLWCSQRKCTFKGYPFSLKKHEAYFYDAYTDPAYRGKGLAFALYLLFGREIHKMGIEKAYNVTEYLNAPAAGLARKIGMQKLHFAITIELLWKWRKTLILRSYSPSEIKQCGFFA